MSTKLNTVLVEGLITDCQNIIGQIRYGNRNFLAAAAHEGRGYFYRRNHKTGEREKIDVIIPPSYQDSILDLVNAWGTHDWQKTANSVVFCLEHEIEALRELLHQEFLACRQEVLARENAARMRHSA